ncbi:MAG: TonB-dependent receptor plug domain-containing protein [Erythrobacter sp.]
MNRFTKGSLLAGTVLATAITATPVYAQDNDSEDNFIVVTGSRIQQRNVETAAPVAVVDAEEFQLTGDVNVENVVNALPQVIPGVTGTSNNPGNGTSTLDLRGLGENRTLVLVNGRRWVSFDTNQIVDLNTIPNFLIESVEVVTGGASAVYGSDAMSGVVNFNLKKVEGVEFGGQYAITEEGDGARYQLYGAIGTSFDDGRGSATVFAEYSQRDEIFQGDRDFSFFAIGGETFDARLQQFGSSTVPQGRINTPGTGTIRPAFDFNGDGEIDNDDPDEQAITSPLGSGLIIDDGIFDTPGSPRARTGDTYNYAPVNYLQVPQERYLMGGYADYEFVDGHTAYTEVAFVNNRVAAELAATPVTGTFNVDIDTVSPFLDQATINELMTLDMRETQIIADRQAYNDGLGYCDPGDVAPEDQRPCFSNVNPFGAASAEGVVSTFLQRRMLETGPRNNLDERNAFRVLAGVRGDITDNLTYDAYYSYSRTRNANVQSGNISRSLFQAGLDGTGTPINIFGQGTLTPAMVQAVSIQAQNGDISTQEIASASVAGFLGELTEGAGDVGFAVGGEYRKVGARFIPDTALASGDVIGFNAGAPTDGTYDVKEIFAELNVPVFDNGTQRLELTGAARYSDYSLDAVGGVWTYAGGAEFDVIPSVKLRGQYQRAVRAPNVAELFGGQAIGFPGATDPCGDPDFLADNPGADQLCIATGVPAGSVGNADAIQLNAQIPALFGGNPDLEEETSTSYSFGVVLRPEFIPGLTITADYFDIVIEDAINIAGGSLQGLLNLCYGDVQDINSPVCQPFVGRRNGDGQITVDNPPLVAGVNVAEIGTSGVDLEVNYRMSLPFGLFGDGDSGLDFSFLGTWTESFFLQPVQDLPAVEECAGKFGGACFNTGDPTSSFRWVSRLSWNDGPVTTSLRWRHLSGVEDADDGTDFTGTVQDPDDADFGLPLNGVERIPAYDVFDLTIAVEASENLTITGGIRNLFDKLPGAPEFDADGFVTNRPSGLLLGDNQEQANTFPSTYDVLGRDFFISAAFSF